MIKTITVPTAIKIIGAEIGILLGWIFGDMNSMFKALIALVVIDYITGVLCGIYEHKLSSEVGYKGICKKVGIFLIIALCNILDQYVFVKTGYAFKMAAICFYIANESLSILENIARLGVPIPEKLKNVLAQLKPEQLVEENKEEDNGRQ